MRAHSIAPRIILFLAFWLVWSCSADSSAPQRGSITGNTTLPTGTGGAAAIGDLGRGSAGSDNPIGVIVPTAPLPVAGAGGGAATTMTTNSSRDPISIDECTGANAAGLAAGDVQKLLAGSGGPGAKWLYPYDGTVFPRGMGAPLLMWDGAADAVYIHIKAKAFEYKACVKPTAAGQFQLPQDIWEKAGVRTYGKSDPYTLELTTISGGTAKGPSVQQFVIAQATIKGSIYYNSYNSMLATMSAGMGIGGGPAGGVVLRIPPGGKAEVFISTGCNGCHTVSADGSRMLSQFLNSDGEAFQLMSMGPTNPMGNMAGPRTAWSSLYPDGSHYLAGSSVIEIAATSRVSQGVGPTDATLYDTSTGQTVTSTGIPGGALMPMFSPDGSLLVFNDYALGMAHGLAIMKYDVKTHTATPLKTLMQDTGSTRPGWPFVLPDNDGVVFVRTDGADFSGNGAGISQGFGGFFGGGAMVAAPASDLHIADVASGTVTILAKAMGYNTPQDAASGTTYLPFGSAELHHNYFPTVSAVAAGGYFWVFFDSLRHYGNLGEGRQLWSTAVEIQADGNYAKDASNPPFYVPGQEFGTGNHRAFAALDPCRKDGDTCTTGIDCCGGFCYKDMPVEIGETIGSCSPKKTMCAKRDERCTSDADCCPPTGNEPKNTCIAGYCAFIQLQ